MFLANIKTQAQVNGTVHDQASRKPIVEVDVINLSNKEHTTTNLKGEFTINAKLNDLLVFKLAGYNIDTVLLINLKPIRRYLILDRNMLKTVTIKGEADIRETYAQVFNKANAVLLTPGRGLLFYPSSYFSREGKQARRFKRMLKREVLEKQIDKRYNAKTITAILPIKQPALDAFIVRYRPSLKFVQQASANDFKSYLLNSYDKFKLLPPEQSVLPSLH
ncbi:MAG: hypothetical protein V4541_01600 [Bacteroidota bacterium]